MTPSCFGTHATEVLPALSDVLPEGDTLKVRIAKGFFESLEQSPFAAVSPPTQRMMLCEAAPAAPRTMACAPKSTKWTCKSSMHGEYAMEKLCVAFRLVQVTVKLFEALAL